jgi:hypothetical protein
MTGLSAAELDGDVSDVIVMLERAFPGWHVLRTSRGVWWATRGILASETLVPDGRTTVKAGTAVELYVRLESASSGRIVTAAPADVNGTPAAGVTPSCEPDPSP